MDGVATFVYSRSTLSDIHAQKILKYYWRQSILVEVGCNDVSFTDTITFICIAFAVRIPRNPSEVYEVYAGCETSL